MSVAALLDDYLDGLLAGEPAAATAPANPAPAGVPAGPVPASGQAQGARMDASGSPAAAHAAQCEPAGVTHVAPDGGDPGQAAGTASPAAADSAGSAVTAAPPAPAPEGDADAIAATPPPAPSAAPVPVPAAPRLRNPALPSMRPAPVMPSPAPALAAHADDPPARRAADRSSRWLRLRCATQPYGLELLKVQEVVLPVPLLPLRGTPVAMLGVMNLRGQVVPVLDLGMHLGQAPQPATAATRFVVIEEKGEVLGLRVSAVEDVVTLAASQVEPPGNAQIGRAMSQLFRGIARQGGEPMVLLDSSCLLAPATTGGAR